MTRFRNRMKVLSSYFRRTPVLSGGPIEITLESTSKCNLYCPMCPRHVYEFDNENMDFDLYRKIIRDCREYVEFVWPYGIGEPMIHPSIFEMIRVARDEGISTGMSTNATLLDGVRAEQLLDSGLDHLIVAFDGASKGTYEKYRVGARFETSRKNVLDFLRRKQERRSRIHVVLQMVLLKDNAHEVDAFRKLWSVSGVDEIRFKRDEIRIEESRIPGGGWSGGRRNPCHLLWRGPLYVRYDGSAHPCCYMYDQPPVGDLKTQTLMEIWNSPQMVKLRRAHLKSDFRDFPSCINCQAPRPSRAAVYGSLALSGLTVRKAVPAMERLSRFYHLGVFEEN